jgi:hypothetical protein
MGKAHVICRLYHYVKIFQHKFSVNQQIKINFSVNFFAFVFYKM